MKWITGLDKQSIIPLYQQIKDMIIGAVKEKKLSIGQGIPSINKLCAEFGLAPNTVIRAYEELKEMGIVSSKQGKGYFISGTQLDQKTKIFLLFDRMTAYKEILYEAFRNELGEDAEIQVFFHHYDFHRFEKLIRENIGKFSNYVIMPHLNGNIKKIMDRIPEKKLVFIDNFPSYLKTNANAVYQNFYTDMYNALSDRISELRRYEALNLSLSQSRFQFVPEGNRTGFSAFCKENNFNFSIIESVHEQNLRKNELYIIFDELELVNTLKMCSKKGWELKSDIGIISFDEAPMKELLAGGISVLSTDFMVMGKTAAKMVKGEIKGQLANPFRLIFRNSF